GTHPTGAGVRGWTCATDRHVGPGGTSDPYRRAAPRYRKAGHSRTYPREAGTADARGVPESSDSSGSRCRDPAVRALSLSRHAADPQPPRTLGWTGVSLRLEGGWDPPRGACSVGCRLLRRHDI